MDEQRPWHRLFALSWTDFFRGLPVTVEVEKDLSIKKQLLDVLVIHREPGPLNCRLPDGFEDLARYNLVTFKSYQEKLSEWSLRELIGHQVNLRKQVSPSMDEDDLVPEEEFQLYAVTSRYPQQLASNVGLEPVAPGVYQVQVLAKRIRIIVANQLPEQEQNALLHLFSSRTELLAYGVQHYRTRSSETSTLLLQLYQRYKQEGQIMPDILEEFARETIERLLEGLPPDELRKHLTVQQRLEGLSIEQRLQGLSAEELRLLAEKLKANGTSASGSG
jgi:hypothetical protein